MSDDRTITSETTQNGSPAGQEGASAQESTGPGYAINGLEVTGYRGLNRLKLEGIGRVNLFIGKNNCGKTSALEAVGLALEPENQELWEIIIGRIGFGRSTQAIEWIFSQKSFISDIHRIDKNKCYFNLQKQEAHSQCITLKFSQEIISSTSSTRQEEIKFLPGLDIGDGQGVLYYLSVILENGNEHELYRHFLHSVNVNPLEAAGYLFPATRVARNNVVAFSGVLKHDSLGVRNTALPYSNLVHLGLEKEIDAIMSILKMLSPEIVDLKILTHTRLGSEIFGDEGTYNNVSSLHLKTTSLGYVPLGAFGDGVKKSLSMLLPLASVRNGALLIDEFEVGIHYSVLEEVLTGLIIAAQRFNVQLFLTTHSLEAIDTLMAACEKAGEQDFITYRLKPGPEEVDVRRWDFEKLKSLRYELGTEIR